MQGDPEVVAALVAGDPRGVEGAYRAYADRLYTFCRGLIERPGEAADAVHDVFVLASQRAALLRDPELFRCWLYALARSECLRVLRGRARRLPVVEPDHVTGLHPKYGLAADEVQELMWSAAEVLDLTDWDVFELVVRHELTPPQVARVLGIAAADAQTRLAGVRTEMAAAVHALLVARTCRRSCPELAALLPDWDGSRLPARAQARVARHVESCGTCRTQARERRLLSPTSLFTAYAAAPFLAVPAELWPRLQASSLEPGFASSREAILARGPELDPETGFPRLPDRHRRLPRLVPVAAAVLVAVLTAGASTLLLTPDQPPDQPPDPTAAGPARPQPVAAPGSPATPYPVDSAASIPASNTGSEGAQPESPTRPPGAPAPAPAPAPDPDQRLPSPPGPTGPLAVEASAEPVCADDGTYQLAATVTASRALAAATLSVEARGKTVDYPMAVDGSTASVRTDPMTANLLRWRVSATDRGQDAAATPQVKINRVCKD